MATRDLEKGIHTDLADKQSYSTYLDLDSLLSAQKPNTEHHDEMLFIIQHQTSELWMKLIIHELKACLEHIHQDELSPAFKILARIGHIQAELTQQWSVLATLTPPEYLKFRPSLGQSSGFQSFQYRAIEFMLGNKNRSYLAPHQHLPETHEKLLEILESPSIYDAFIMYLSRHGHDVPSELLDRDWSIPHESHPGLLKVFKTIYANTKTHWAEYEMAEKLVDVEERFQFWRFRHLSTVRRIIGGKTGTGGSTGVEFLRRALDLVLFPELWEVRTHLTPEEISPGS